jgi:serine/threonine-protein kinase
MAPEQARGDPVGPAADLYAVGAVLFELLTGRPPFVADHPIAVLFAHLQEPPPPPNSLAEGIPPALDDAVLRALAKDPAERHADAAEMAHALGEALAVRPLASATDLTDAEAAVSLIEGTSDDLPSAADAPTLVHSAIDAPQPVESPRSRSRRRAAAILGAALLSVALVATVVRVTAMVTRGGDGGGNDGAPGAAVEASATEPVAVAAAFSTPEQAPATAAVGTAHSPSATASLILGAAATAGPTATATATASRTATATSAPSPTVTATRTPLPTRTPQPTQTPAPTEIPPPPPPVSHSFGAADWQGGYYQGNGAWYGRAWTAVYGAQSPYPAATLTFELDAEPTGAATLTVVGLDDEYGGTNPIRITVNGVEIFNGAAPFASWDAIGRGEGAAWTPANFSVPAGVLRAGANQITVSNLSPSANFGLPPYLLLSDAKLDIDGG